MSFVCLKSTFISRVGTFLGLNLKKQRIKVSCSGTLNSTAGETRTSSTSISSRELVLYHCKPRRQDKHAHPRNLVFDGRTMRSQWSYVSSRKTDGFWGQDSITFGL